MSGHFTPTLLTPHSRITAKRSESSRLLLTLARLTAPFTSRHSHPVGEQAPE